MSDLYELPQLNTPAGDWAARAKCKGMDPRTFFPERGGNYKDALAVCAQCEVTTECLEYARTNGLREGVFGGKTHKERYGLPIKRRCVWCRGSFLIVNPRRGGNPANFCSDSCRELFAAERRASA